MKYSKIPEIAAKEGRLYDGFFDDNFGEKRYKKSAIIGVTLAFFVVLIAFVFSPPTDFPRGVIFEVKQGENLKTISLNLKDQKIIKFPRLFQYVVYVMGGEKKMKAGSYIFEKKESMFAVISRMMKGYGGFPLVKILIPEGMSVAEMGEILSAHLGKSFEVHKFQALAIHKEGYLFPDTYYFSQNISPEEVINSMQINFEKKISAVEAEIKKSGRSLSDIIKMASIVEEEAADFEDRRKVAGILWKRLDMGMPLQVDAAFGYVLGKTSLELTAEDLRKDSPYNTYTRIGLPPTPISNPGLDSIRAVLSPIETRYFYYLSDRNGKIHYAITHDEHIKNKRKYINS
jgi:UPF0755 protein